MGTPEQTSTDNDNKPAKSDSKAKVTHLKGCTMGRERDPESNIVRPQITVDTKATVKTGQAIQITTKNGQDYHGKVFDCIAVEGVLTATLQDLKPGLI